MERFMRAVPFWQPLQEKVLWGCGNRKSGEPRQLAAGRGHRKAVRRTTRFEMI